MDRLTGMAGDAAGGGIGEALQGVSWPIGRDDLAALLEQRGVPSQVVDRIRGSDTDQFSSQDDVMSKVSGLM